MKYLVINDLHFGNNKNKTSNIINNFWNFFKENHNTLIHIDVLFIAGDTFDKLLSTTSDDFLLSNTFLLELSIVCLKNKIKLRILEGTPSHDVKQAKILENTLQTLMVDVDFKYFSEISIENINDNNVLYVPDLMHINQNELMNDINVVLKQNNLSQVDIAIIHGSFSYQLPNVKNINFLSENFFLKIVQGYIHVGHIHTFSVFNRIISTGSFDRISHGEEEDKGCIYVDLNEVTGGNSFVFLKNTNAMLFKTFNVSEETDVNQLAETIKNSIDSNKPHEIRLKTVNEQQKLDSLSKLLSNYNIKMSISKDKHIRNIERQNVMENVVVLTSDTIYDVLSERLNISSRKNTYKEIFNEELEKLK
jgi:hypothetical protein